MKMVAFVGWLIYEQPEAVFRERGIVRQLQHRNFATHHGGNGCRIIGIVIRSANTTSRIPYISLFFFFSYSLFNVNIKNHVTNIISYNIVIKSDSSKASPTQLKFYYHLKQLRKGIIHLSACKLAQHLTRSLIKYRC